MQGGHAVTGWYLSQWSILVYNGHDITSKAHKLLSASAESRHQHESSASSGVTVWKGFRWKPITHKEQSEACYRTQTASCIYLFGVSYSSSLCELSEKLFKFWIPLLKILHLIFFHQPEIIMANNTFSSVGRLWHFMPRHLNCFFFLACPPLIDSKILITAAFRQLHVYIELIMMYI